jgi:hypothetical protein
VGRATFVSCSVPVPHLDRIRGRVLPLVKQCT